MRDYINRADEKWGHPEAIQEGWFNITMTSFCDTIKSSREELKESANMMNNAMKDMVRTNDTEPYKNTKWQEFYTGKNCAEEPDGPSIRVLVGMPKDIGEDEKLPLFFGFSTGILVSAHSPAELGITIIRPYIYESTKRFIQISYDTPRCIPAHQYPASINDAHAAYQWVIDHAEELHIDTDRIVWTGISSGGHSALCTAFRMKRYNWGGAPMPRGIVPIVPVMDDTALNVSNQYYLDKEDGSKAGWDSELACITYKAWLGDRYGDPTLSPEAVPNRATLEDVKGYPPVWIPGEAEFDCGRDSVYKFVALLHEAGVFCDLHVWGGTTHQGFSYGDSHFGKRIHSIITGAIRDAIEYDFRRAWLYAAEGEN